MTWHCGYMKKSLLLKKLHPTVNNMMYEIFTLRGKGDLNEQFGKSLIIIKPEWGNMGSGHYTVLFLTILVIKYFDKEYEKISIVMKRTVWSVSDLKTQYSRNGQIYTWEYHSLLLRLRPGKADRIKNTGQPQSRVIRGEDRTTATELPLFRGVLQVCCQL